MGPPKGIILTSVPNVTDFYSHNDQNRFVMAARRNITASDLRPFQLSFS